jgi:hypothetical protein
MRTDASRNQQSANIARWHRRVAFERHPWTIAEMQALAASATVPVTKCPSALAQGINHPEHIRTYGEWRIPLRGAP